MAFAVGAIRRGCGGVIDGQVDTRWRVKGMRENATYVKLPPLLLITRVLVTSVGFVVDLAQETRFSPTGEKVGIWDLAMMCWPQN